MVLKQLHNVVGFLNTNTLFAGIMLLTLNVAGRFIIHEIEGTDDEYAQNIFLRRLAIFAVCFVGTKDFIISLILTASFVILAGGIFRPWCREGMTNAQTAAVVSITGGGPYGGAADKGPGLFEK
jgi:hypothetical protein